MKDKNLKYHYTHQGETVGGFLTKTAAILEASKISETLGVTVKVYTPTGRVAEIIHPNRETLLPKNRPPKCQRNIRLSDECWELIHEAAAELKMDLNDVIEKSLLTVMDFQKMDMARRQEYGKDLIQRGLDILRKE